jgi:hypothetical protein
MAGAQKLQHSGKLAKLIEQHRNMTSALCSYYYLLKDLWVGEDFVLELSADQKIYSVIDNYCVLCFM